MPRQKAEAPPRRRERASLLLLLLLVAEDGDDDDELAEATPDRQTLPAVSAMLVPAAP